MKSEKKLFPKCFYKYFQKYPRDDLFHKMTEVGQNYKSVFLFQVRKLYKVLW